MGYVTTEQLLLETGTGKILTSNTNGYKVIQKYLNILMVNVDSFPKFIQLPMASDIPGEMNVTLIKPDENSVASYVLSSKVKHG